MRIRHQSDSAEKEERFLAKVSINHPRIGHLKTLDFLYGQQKTMHGEEKKLAKVYNRTEHFISCLMIETKCQNRKQDCGRDYRLNLSTVKPNINMPFCLEGNKYYG